MAGTITATSRNDIVGILIGLSAGYVPWLAVGVGSGTASATDVALFQEVQPRTGGNISQVTTTTSGDTYQWVGLFTSSSVQTLTNLGLFYNATSPVQDQLASAVNSNSQSFILPVNYYSWPTNYPYQLQAGSEVMTVVSGNNYNTLYVLRGQNNSTASTSIPATTYITQGSGMFVKTNFTGLSLSAGDTIQFTINVQFQ